MKQEVNIETEEIYKGYKIYVMKITNDFPIFWIDMSDVRTYYNGYIVLPENSKFYRKNWDFIDNEIKVHGGFTYANFVDNEYTIGFDTVHCFDNKHTQNVAYVLKELKNAVDQIIQSENK